MGLIRSGWLVAALLVVGGCQATTTPVIVTSTPRPPTATPTATATATATATPTATPTVTPTPGPPTVVCLPDVTAIRTMAVQGDQVAVGGDGGLALVDLAERSVRWSAASPDPVVLVRLSPDGTRVASRQGSSPVIALWRGGVQVARLDAGAGATDMAWSAGGDYLAAGNELGSVAIWQAEDGEELFQVRLYEERIQDLAWAPTSDILASSTWRTGQYALIIPNGETVQRGSAGGQVRITWAPDESAFAINQETIGDTAIIDTGTGERIDRWAAAVGFPPTLVAWSPDAGQVAIASGGSLSVYDAATAESLFAAENQTGLRILRW
ncbi:MAG: WD40 repeat domain-containing protein, partial [Anaerolineae bacterium]